MGIQEGKRLAELMDWRGKTLATVRKSILEADREIIEEWKWMGSPVWSRDGIIAVGNAYRAIDLFEVDKVNKPSKVYRSRFTASIT